MMNKLRLLEKGLKRRSAFATVLTLFTQSVVAATIINKLQDNDAQTDKTNPTDPTPPFRSKM